ncbi:MAG: TauD/TfdA family dioxygenase [Rhodospirillaceae bacterium]|jgi:taurine dioxygenase|nr:TauD/TfdA family dioxygenase [Rhodospirillaceae bacterium]MBT5895683.1 TauD/TfdA family dioxygenase [Rhodospirillaceae bacterium]
MTITITSTDAALGARVTGIDLSQELAPETVEELRAIIHEHLVVVFPDQDFSPEEQLRFAEYLGPVARRKLPEDYDIPDSSREVPGIVYVSNIRTDDGKVDGVIPDGEMWFHHDTCYKPEPDRFTMLYGVTVPNNGGHTMWANMVRAWETLPDDLKAALKGRKALNVYDYATIERPDLSDLDKVEHAWQPAVVTHPVTGRDALFVNRLMSCQLDGLDDAEGLKILNAVFDHAEQRQFIYEHAWSVGDFVIWDNLACTHARTHFDLGDDRRLRRSKVGGAALID